MKRRFPVEPIVAVLKQAELGLPVADWTRKLGISEQTFFRWKKQYTGLETDQVRGFKQLTEENARLQRLVACVHIDKGFWSLGLSPVPAPLHQSRDWSRSGSKQQAAMPRLRLGHDHSRS